MLGWLTALLVTLVVIATANVRERENFPAANPSGVAEANSISTDYQSLLDAYSAAYLASKKTGGNQDALATVQSQIAAQQDAMRKQIAQNQFYIQTFLDEYQNMNPELDALHAKAQVFRKEGPKVADELVASNAELSTPVDYGSLVTRVVVLVLLLGVGMAINAFA